MGRWEYEFCNISKSRGPYAFLNLPMEIKYTFFYLLPKKSLLDKVFIAFTGTGIETSIVVNPQLKKLWIEEYIKQLQVKIDEVKKKINEVRKQLEKEE